MRTKIFKLSVVLVSVFLMLGTANYIHCQTKDDNACLRAASGDFNIKPVKMIKMKIIILEIKPADTIEKTDAVVMTKDGGEAEVRIGSHSPKIGEITTRIKINPKIVIKKGIEINLKIKISPEMNSFVNKTVLAKNYEEVIVELFKHKKEKKKLVAKITPFIEKIPGAKRYPHPVTELSVRKALVLMNDIVITKGPSVSAASEEGDIALFIYAAGKGLYVLAFKPFAGAEAVGAVNKNIIMFRLGGDEFTIEAKDPLLPPGKWLVWVRNNPNYKPDPKWDNIGKGNGYIGISTGELEKY